MGTFNGCVKIDYKFLTVCEKMKKIQITLGGGWLTLYNVGSYLPFKANYLLLFNFQKCTAILWGLRFSFGNL